MLLEIVTPEASIFKGEVNAVSVPGINGQFQMLNNHAPIVSLLQAGDVKFNGEVTIDEEYQDKFTTDKSDTVLSITSGTVEMNDNKVIILVD